MQDKAYKEANKRMKDEQKSGKLKDEYTGKKIKQNAGDNFSNLGERKTFITMIQNPETTELNCIKKKNPRGKTQKENQYQQQTNS